MLLTFRRNAFVMTVTTRLYKCYKPLFSGASKTKANERRASPGKFCHIIYQKPLAAYQRRDDDGRLTPRKLKYLRPVLRSIRAPTARSVTPRAPYNAVRPDYWNHIALLTCPQVDDTSNIESSQDRECRASIVVAWTCLFGARSVCDCYFYGR